MAPRPEPEPPKNEEFAALLDETILRSVEPTERREQAATEQAGTGRTREGSGQAQSLLGEGRLTMSEMEAVMRQIHGCWAVPPSAVGRKDLVSQLQVKVGPDRNVQEVTIKDQARLERDPMFRSVAESAKRAVENCGTLDLPPEKYSAWRDILMSFDPEDAVSG